MYTANYGYMKRLSRYYWLLLTLIPATAYAQTFQILTDEGGCDYVSGKIKAKCFPILIGHLVQVIFSLIGVYFLINVIIAGHQILFGGGDLGDGKARIFASFTGFISAACSFLVIDLVITLAGA